MYGDVESLEDLEVELSIEEQARALERGQSLAQAKRDKQAAQNGAE